MNTHTPVDLDDRSLYLIGSQAATFAYVDARQSEQPLCAITHPVKSGYLGSMLSDEALETIISLTKAFAQQENGSFVWSAPQDKQQAREIMFVPNT